MENIAVITVLGKDRKGIIAAISQKLAEGGANILDISQTILRGMFTMTMMVDCSDLGIGFDEMRASLAALGSEMGIEVRMQRKEIFEAMHRL